MNDEWDANIVNCLLYTSAVASVEESKQRGPRYKNNARPRNNKAAEVNKPAKAEEKTEA